MCLYTSSVTTHDVTAHDYYLLELLSILRMEAGKAWETGLSHTVQLLYEN